EIRHEPKQALVSGADGLNDIKTIINKTTDYLNEDGILFIEHGYNQGIKVCALMQQSGFTNCKTTKDLSANDRVTLGVWQSNS
ncbi:MAG: protein-(glutamine-N5) methyltransferase, release factor-specific, partial [Thiotrichaceae bacterium]